MEYRDTLEHEYAGFWIRLAAYILDGIVLACVSALLDALFGAKIFKSPLWLDLTEKLIALAYYVVLTVIYGQTLGKMAVGIRVIRQDGKPNTWGAILLREIVGKPLSFLILGIGFLMIAFDRQKRALHDRLAKTYVVKVR